MKKGVPAVVMAALLFSLGGFLIKLIPWRAMSIASGRCLFSSLFILLYIRLSKHKIKFNKTILISSVFVCLCLLSYVISTKLTTAANATVLEYTAPIFIIIIEAIFFKKKASLSSILTCVVVFGGIIIFFIDSLGKGRILGDFVALASGLFYAMVIMNNNFAGSDSLSSIFFGHALAFICGMPFIFAESNFTFSTIGLILCLGIFQAGCGYLFLTIGLQDCDPLSASLAASIEPLLNPILVALIYHEYISFKCIVGAFIVLLAVVVYNVRSINNN